MFLAKSNSSSVKIVTVAILQYICFIPALSMLVAERIRTIPSKCNSFLINLNVTKAYTTPWKQHCSWLRLLLVRYH